MGDIINIRPKGSALETLYQAAKEVGEEDSLKAIVILFADCPTEMTCMYSENVDPVSAYYALSVAAQWQVEMDDE